MAAGVAGHGQVEHVGMGAAHGRAVTSEGGEAFASCQIPHLQRLVMRAGDRTAPVPFAPQILRKSLKQAVFHQNLLTVVNCRDRGIAAMIDIDEGRPVDPIRAWHYL